MTKGNYYAKQLECCIVGYDALALLNNCFSYKLIMISC